MVTTSAWIEAVRSTHDHFAAVLRPLSEDAVRGRSYATDWSIADTASHLGSQAEIFDLFLDAGLVGGPAPGGDVFGGIWDRWNALPPTEQVAQSVATDEAFVTRVEQTPDEQRERFSLTAFGSEQDLAGLLATRLGELAVHTWDIEVALDDTAEVWPTRSTSSSTSCPRPSPGAGTRSTASSRSSSSPRARRARSCSPPGARRAWCRPTTRARTRSPCPPRPWSAWSTAASTRPTPRPASTTRASPPCGRRSPASEPVESS